MSAVLTTVLPLLAVLVAAASLTLLAQRRRQPKLVPAYARRPDERIRYAEPQPRPRPRGCNW